MTATPISASAVISDGLSRRRDAANAPTSGGTSMMPASEHQQPHTRRPASRSAAGPAWRRGTGAGRWCRAARASRRRRRPRSDAARTAARSAGGTSESSTPAANSGMRPEIGGGRGQQTARRRRARSRPAASRSTPRADGAGRGPARAASGRPGDGPADGRADGQEQHEEAIGMRVPRVVDLAAARSAHVAPVIDGEHGDRRRSPTRRTSASSGAVPRCRTAAAVTRTQATTPSSERADRDGSSRRPGRRSRRRLPPMSKKVAGDPATAA